MLLLLGEVLLLFIGHVLVKSVSVLGVSDPMRVSSFASLVIGTTGGPVGAPGIVPGITAVLKLYFMAEVGENSHDGRHAHLETTWAIL